MTNRELLEYNRLGLIPGPLESEEAFEKRARYCLNLKEEIAKQLALPFEKGEQHDREKLSPAFVLAEQLYDIVPTWIPLFFSNYRLAPWHGGCAWIFQQSDESPTAAFLQLRRSFARKERYLGLYTRSELMAHELCHVGRMCFEEPRFEEILAYRSSPSKLRRWLGAIAQSSWETGSFVLLICLLFALDLYALSSNPQLLSHFAWLKLLPLLLLGYGVLRLYKRQSEFAACLKNLEQILDRQKAAAVIYRLTDREISSFAALNHSTLRTLLNEKKEDSLRWRLIHEAYL